MAIVKFKGDYLENTISPVVSSSKVSFKEAKHSAHYSLPSNFRYNSILQEVPNKIDNIILRTENFIDWINKCNKVYNDVNNNIEEMKDIEMINIKPRMPAEILRKSVK